MHACNLATLAGLIVMVLMGTPAGAALLVDFGTDGSDVQDGYVRMGDAGGGNNNNRARSQAFSGVDLGEGIVADVTISFTALDTRDRGSVNVEPAELLRDAYKEAVGGGVFTASAFTMTLAGLPAGTYDLTMWHHDSSDAGDTDVALFLDTGAGYGDDAVATSIVSNGQDPDPIGTTSFQFTATGGDVLVDFRRGSGSGSEIFLNGLDLSFVPEPGSLACLLVGILLIARRR